MIGIIAYMGMPTKELADQYEVGNFRQKKP